MTGEILRLKTFKHYGRVVDLKKSKAAFVFRSATAKAQPGKHIIVATIAQVPEDMELTKEFIKERMAEMGWVEAPDEEAPDET